MGTRYLDEVRELTKDGEDLALDLAELDDNLAIQTWKQELTSKLRHDSLNEDDISHLLNKITEFANDALAGSI